MMDGVEQRPHIEALELFADLLARVEGEPDSSVFYGQMCDAICRLTSMERAVIFRYDETRRRVLAVGAHGLDLGLLRDLHVTVESVPLARTALEQDRVTEAAEGFERELPDAWRDEVEGRHLVFTPIAASGRWVGVVLSDRPRTEAPLSEEEKDLLWTLGKTAALAAVARSATYQAERARQLQGRIDMAREIHDGVIQRLFGVSLVLTAGHEPLDPEARGRCGDEVQGALADLRAALTRPLGRVARPTQTTLTEELDRLDAEHPGLGLTLDGAGREPVPEHLEPLAQSVLAEAVRNALKHAAPTHVGVSWGPQDGAFVLQVTNNGVDDSPHAHGGMGLRLAAFEALQLGGVLDFGPAGSDCWQVRLVVPYEHG